MSHSTKPDDDKTAVVSAKRAENCRDLAESRLVPAEMLEGEPGQWLVKTCSHLGSYELPFFSRLQV